MNFEKKAALFFVLTLGAHVLLLPRKEALPVLDYPLDTAAAQAALERACLP